MPKRSRKQEPEDINQVAFRIVRDSTTGEPDLSDEKARKELARALGKRGGLKGGKVRAAKMTPEQRRKSASDAARARWAQAKKS
jgi:hypothetical protein